MPKMKKNSTVSRIANTASKRVKGVVNAKKSARRTKVKAIDAANAVAKLKLKSDWSKRRALKQLTNREVELEKAKQRGSTRRVAAVSGAYATGALNSTVSGLNEMASGGVDVPRDNNLNSGNTGRESNDTNSGRYRYSN